MMRVALLQTNPRVGDAVGNLARLRAALDRLVPPDGERPPPDLVQYSDAAVMGHPIEGLAYRVSFRRAWSEARVAAHRLEGPAGGYTLPDGVMRLHFPGLPDLGESGSAALAVAAGARVLLVDALRPYRVDRIHRHEEEVGVFARRHGVWWLEANLAGGQGEEVMAGGSLVVDPDGAVRARAKAFAADELLFELADDFSDGRLVAGRHAPCPAEPDALHDALVAAVRDYVEKSGVRGVLLGLSGGIDSAVAAALAVAALGPERVLGATLPGPCTSRETLADAHRLAANLGIVCHEIPVVSLYEQAKTLLAPAFEDAAAGPMPPDPEDLTGQNLQARARGLMLMAIANRRGLLVLNTSNKSEICMGYGTLYGDLVGGFAPLSDVYKSQVWTLARLVNQRFGRERIPATTIDRAPSAELRPNQADTDSLPPYEVLDGLLQGMLEQVQPFETMLEAGFDRAVAALVWRRWVGAEYKRRQAIPGPRVQASADWPERRLPLLNVFVPPGVG